MTNRIRRSWWSRLRAPFTSAKQPASRHKQQASRRQAFLESLEDRSMMATGVFANVPEAANYSLVYELNITGTNNFPASVPYSVNNTTSITNPFDRVAYYLELDTDGAGPAPTEWVYVSANALTTNLSKIGVPNLSSGAFFQQNLTSMNVFSNKAGIVTGTGINTGNIEFWPSNYSQANGVGVPNASSGTYDFGDTATAGSHGSMQIHNYDLDGAGPGTTGQTLFAFNNWNDGTLNAAALGIGTDPNPAHGADWTFAANVGTYQIKNMAILVRQTTPNTLTPPATLTTNAPELTDYQLLYQKALPNDANYSSGAVAYDTNNAALIPANSFDRIAYYMELDSDGAGPNPTQWVSASFDSAGYSGNPLVLGIPNTASTAIFQQYVTGMNVFSNVAGLPATNVTGNVEFWPTDYSTGNALGIPGANGGTYDFGDTRTLGGGHGSMQIHNSSAATAVGKTLFAYNGWNGAGFEALGIGAQSTGQPDWTFATNSNTYAVKNLYVLVHPRQGGTAAADNIVVKQVNGVGQYTVNGGNPITFSATSPLVLNGTDGADTVTVDLTGGNPIPTGGITFNGGNPTASPGDKLQIVGGNQGNVTYNYTNASSGSVVMQNFGTINYTGLEPISNTGTAANVIFNLPGTTDSTIALSDLGGGMARLQSTVPTFEVTDFAVPTAGGSLTINMGNNDQTLTINSLVLNANTSLVIDGGAGTDAVNLNAAGLSITNNLSLTVENVAQTQGVSVTNLTTLNGSGTFSLTNAANNFNTVNVAAGGNVSLRDDNTGLVLTGATVTSNLTIDSDDPVTQTGIITGAGSLTKQGTGTLTLSLTNTYGGATAVNVGTLILQNGAAILDTAGAVTVANAATLQLLNNETISGFTGAATSTLAHAGNALTVNTGNVSLGNVTTTNGRINAVAGAIVDNNAAAMNITGTGIVLNSATGIGAVGDPLETTLSALEAVGGTGGVFISNSGNLTLGGISAVVGVSGSNDLVITTAGSLSIPEVIVASGAGSVLFTTTDAAGVGQDIAVNANLTAGGVITLSAGDNVTIPAGTRLAAAGTVMVNIDAGNADPGVGGSLVFDGDIDAPGAVFNGVGDTNGDSFDVRPDQDVGDVLTPITVNGFAPVTGAFPVGDRLIVDIAGLGIPTLTLGAARSGSFSFGALAAALTYSDIESVVSDPPGSAYHLVLDMKFSGFQNGVADTINAQLNPAGIDLLLDVNGSNVFTGAVASIQSLTVIGSSDNDSFTIQQTAGGLPSFKSAAPAVNNTGIGGGVSAGSHLNTSADNVLETLVPGGTPWDANDVTIHFDGGAAGTDTVTLNQTTGTLTGYFSDTNDAGNSGNLIAPFKPFLFSFANVEPLVLTGPGSLITDATSTPATANLTLTDIGPATQILGDGGFAATTFSGFTDVLVAGGNGSENIDLVSVDNATLTLVRLAGGNTNDLLAQPGGDTAADTIRLRSLPATIQALLAGYAGSDNFLLSDAGNSVDNIAGNVTVDGTDGNVGGNADTLSIVNTGSANADNALVGAVNPGVSQDYFVDGVTSNVSTDVVFRNIDVLNYTGTTFADAIEARLVNTTPTHDLSTVNLSGWTGADQFLLFTSDQRGGSGVNNTPTGTPSGVSNVNLYGDAPGNPNAGDSSDTFGQTPIGIVGTGANNVGLVVPDSTRMIRPSGSTAIAIDGGQPTGLAAPLGDVAGDVLNVDISALPNTTPVVVSTFSPGTVVATGISPLTWTQIEDINVVDQGLLTNVQMGDLFARTTPNADLIQLTANPVAGNPNQVRLRLTSTIGNYSASNKTIIYAGAGNDTLTQSNLTIPAEFYGEAGDDYLTGAMNNDWLVGGTENDRINGSGGNNIIWGDNAPTTSDPNPQDALTGGNDQLSGLSGNDVFYGSGGNDTVSGGAGNDYASGGAGDDSLDGNDGDDRLYGGAGNDLIGGQAGNDLLSGGDGADRLYGGSGSDVVLGGNGTDQLDGGDGNDLIIGAIVAGETSSRTSVANTTTFSQATYTNGLDNDAALLTLLTQWSATNDSSSIGAITHDHVKDELFGGSGEDDFCWETIDVSPGLAPSDFAAGDQRIPPNA